MNANRIPTKSGWIVKETRATGGSGQYPGTLILYVDSADQMKNYTNE